MNEATRKKVLYVVLGLAVVWGAWHFSHPRKRYSPGTEPATTSTAPATDTLGAKKPPVNIDAKRAEAWGRDPFKSAKYQPIAQANFAPVAASTQEMTRLGWSLTGILYSATAPMAFINGRMVRIGDMIDRALVVSIDKQKVRLSVNGKAFDLFVNKG